MKKYILVLLVLCLFSSCRQDDVPGFPQDAEKELTFFIYMAADNSLGNRGSEYDYKNMALLLRGVRLNHLLTNNIVIYQDPSVANPTTHSQYPEYAEFPTWEDKRPRLLRVEFDRELNKPVITQIKQYEEQNSGTAENLSAILAEVKTLFQTPRYGFLMWSHGTGWLPPNPDYTSRAIGQDGNSWIDVEDFADALPNRAFDFMLFDACYMAGVETAYALRNKTDYIIASATEIMGEGMPYHLMPSYLLGTNPMYREFCDGYYQYYKGASGNSSISLIETRHMEELAAAVKYILTNKQVEDVYALNINQMQWFDRTAQNVHPYHLFFDLEEYMEKLATASQLAALQETMSKAVPYSIHSDAFLPSQGGFRIDRYSGLSTYIPRNIGQLQNVNEYYKTMEWYGAVYPAGFGF